MNMRWMALSWTLPAVALAADAETAEQGMTFLEIFQAGGRLMYPIVALSVLGLALIVYFLLTLRAEQVAPRRWLKQAAELLDLKRYDEARALCDRKPSPLAAVAAAALDYVRGASEPQPELLKEIMAGEGIRQATRLQNQTQYLLDIAVVAPMIGLLGTVMGMLQAFNAVALDLAKAKPMLLAGGVSLALVTTVAGLIVAIPAMIAYAYFRNRTSGLVSRLEIASTELLTRLLETHR